MRITWSDKEKDVLKKMAEAGYSLTAIQKVLLSRTAHAIRSQADAMGLDISEKPKIDFEAFKSMLKGAKQKCV
jgi:hypothetical protein